MFDSLFGIELPLPAKFFIAFLVVLGLIGATAWIVRRFGADRLGGSSARGRQPRLAVIDASPVDSRRKLVLIRRDNVEHLIMIGGPTDVVVEQNIVRAANAASPRDLSREPAAPRIPEPAVRPIEGSSWPLQPEPPVPAAPPVARPHRGALTDEPWLAPEPGARPRPSADSLSGLASELAGRLSEPKLTPQAELNIPPVRPVTPEPRVSEPRLAEQRVVQTRALAEMRAAETRAIPEPRIPEPRTEVRPGEPRMPEPRMPETPREPRVSELRAPEPPRPAEPSRAPEPAMHGSADVSADQNLAEMAQRLEAALRRPLTSSEPRADLGARPPVTDPLAVPPVEPVRAKSEPRPAPSAPKPPRPELKAEAKPAPEAKPAADSKPAASKNLYDNLEQEMASLLGRPTNKA